MSNLRAVLEEQPEEHQWDKGVSIAGFKEGSAAQGAGMKKGDVIVEYDGIGDLTTGILPTLTASTSRKNTTTRVVFVRDGQEHSVDVPRGPLGISGQDAAGPSSVQRRMAHDRTVWMVQTIRRIYLAFAILSLFGIMAELVESAGSLEVLRSVVTATICGVIYFGLRYRKEWVITLLLIFSAFSSFLYFVAIMLPAENITALVGKIVSLFLLLFFAYNIVYFRRAHVRALFRDRGTLVF